MFLANNIVLFNDFQAVIINFVVANMVSTTNELIAAIGVEFGEESFLKISLSRHFHMYQTATPETNVHGHLFLVWPWHEHWIEEEGFNSRMKNFTPNILSKM